MTRSIAWCMPSFTANISMYICSCYHLVRDRMRVSRLGVKLQQFREDIWGKCHMSNVTCHIWHVTVTSDMWNMAYDTWHIPGGYLGDMSHMKCEMWHFALSWMYSYSSSAFYWSCASSVLAIKVSTLMWQSQMTCELWHVTYDIWFMIFDMFHVTLEEREQTKEARGRIVHKS